MPENKTPFLQVTVIDALFNKVASHINEAQQAIQHTVNTEMVKAYWLIGREIVEEEQGGSERAGYGKALLKQLSTKLQGEYNRGFGVDTLEQARRFYLIYQSGGVEGKSDAPRRKLAQLSG